MEDIVIYDPQEIQLRLRGGNPSQRIDAKVSSYLYIMEHDEVFQSIRYNELTNRPEVIINTTNDDVVEVRRWKDADEAEGFMYIEDVYGLNKESAYDKALCIFLSKVSFNPIAQLLDALVWDGVSRCEEFLVKWGKVEDTPYNREVSRLIFAGGVNRAYRPGCKYDDVPIFIGKQGMGKSSLIRFLAINDEYFGEVKDFDGNPSIEAIEGKWVCEIPEMSAFKKRDMETVKAYITRQVDRYRKPYQRNAEDYPRRCVIIGTANERSLLVDKTGNRRFYPVHIGLDDKFWLVSHESEVRAYIIQCWAEAVQRYKDGNLPAYADPKLVNVYEKMQAEAEIEDPREGAILVYLDKKKVGEYVCTRELHYEAIPVGDEKPKEMTMGIGKDIASIMDKVDGWERCKSNHKFEKYGIQRAWVKKKIMLLDTDEKAIPFEPVTMPEVIPETIPEPEVEEPQEEESDDLIESLFK